MVRWARWSRPRAGWLPLEGFERDEGSGCSGMVLTRSAQAEHGADEVIWPKLVANRAGACIAVAPAQRSRRQGPRRCVTENRRKRRRASAHAPRKHRDIGEVQAGELVGAGLGCAGRAAQGHPRAKHHVQHDLPDGNDACPPSPERMETHGRPRGLRRRQALKRLAQDAAQSPSDQHPSTTSARVRGRSRWPCGIDMGRAVHSGHAIQAATVQE